MREKVFVAARCLPVRFTHTDYRDTRTTINRVQSRLGASLETIWCSDTQETFRARIMAINATHLSRHGSAGKPIPRGARPEHAIATDHQDLYRDTVMVLSYLPYCRCGVTGALLGKDCFGDESEDGQSEARAKLCLLYAVSRLRISIHRANDRNDVTEYWLDDPPSKMAVESILAKSGIFDHLNDPPMVLAEIGKSGVQGAAATKRVGSDSPGTRVRESATGGSSSSGGRSCG